MHFLQSLDVDRWMFRADVWVSKAHVIMLKERRIISPSDARKILKALSEIEKEGIQSIELESHEDLHTALEKAVIKRAGDSGMRMHTARSRNDEVSACIRVSLRDELLRIMELIVELREALLKRAGENLQTLMPGYTHLQRAQPTTLAHHLMAYVEALQRDFKRVADSYNSTNANPLGACALASTGFNIDPHRTAELLGFPTVLRNSMDASSSRDFVLQTIASLSILMVDLSRLAEELILWSSEFGFVKLHPSHLTGSSIMPQKRNPDYAELIRSMCSSVHGDLCAALSICKALPYSYNRDLQQLSKHLLSSVQICKGCLEIMIQLISKAEFNADAMREKVDAWVMATEVADELVRSTGIPFRMAHTIVSRLEKMDYAELSKVFREVDGRDLSSAGFDEKKFMQCIDPKRCVELRKHGGPSPSEVERTISIGREVAESDRKWIEERKREIDDARGKVERIVDESRTWG